jgi:hypothetical protein
MILDDAREGKIMLAICALSELAWPPETRISRS